MSIQTEIPRMLALPVAPLAIEPVTLEGRQVRLEPLSMDHFAPLCEVALDEDLWRWTPGRIETPEDLQAYIALALRLRSEGSVLPFATFNKRDSRFVGSSRFMSIDRANHHVEIGATWVGRPWQRTAVNTEAKYLMLRHAFETLGCLRVELKTDLLNVRSQKAILRIGAKQEGVFRNHMICADGRVRDSVYFSITDDDWPSVKAGLEEKVARPYPSRA